ncbi:MAG: hypothetical protein OEW00_10120 [candidate division Zixibacteria bacterium]|nr:hypothetical protein [candidate division Zixibacteria bacterium]
MKVLFVKILLLLAVCSLVSGPACIRQQVRQFQRTGAEDKCIDHYCFRLELTAPIGSGGWEESHSYHLAMTITDIDYLQPNSDTVAQSRRLPPGADADREVLRTILSTFRCDSLILVFEPSSTRLPVPLSKFNPYSSAIFYKVHYNFERPTIPGEIDHLIAEFYFSSMDEDGRRTGRGTIVFKMERFEQRDWVG